MNIMGFYIGGCPECGREVIVEGWDERIYGKPICDECGDMSVEKLKQFVKDYEKEHNIK